MNFCTTSFSRTTLLLLFCLAVPATAQSSPTQSSAHKSDNQTSPARRIERDRHHSDDTRRDTEYRSFDGSGNHRVIDDMNESHTPLARWMPVAYSDLISSMAGAQRPSARAISNEVVAQDSSIPNPKNASDFLWQWGQFLDHDLDLTDGISPPEPHHIPVPAGDRWFDPTGTGAQVIPFNRSIYELSSGIETVNPRAQINEITGWIDGSQVYGSDPVRAAALRTNDGSGRLKTSDGDLLPFNTEGLANAGGAA